MSSAARPGMLFDYGFPPHTYELSCAWRAAGRTR